MSVTETFRVREVNGTQEYVVIGVRTDTLTSTLDRRANVPGVVQYHLADGGGYLKVIDKDTFEIIKTGQRVRRIS